MEFFIPLPHKDQLRENVPDAFLDNNINTRESPGIEQPPAFLEEKNISAYISMRSSGFAHRPGWIQGAQTTFTVFLCYGCLSLTESSLILLTPENDPLRVRPLKITLALENRGISNSQGQNAEGVNSRGHEPLPRLRLPPVISSIIADPE